LKSAVEHQPGHRILVAFAKGDLEDLMYLHYHCDDPTCDWSICEYGPDECKEIANIVDDLLTLPNETITLDTNKGATRAVKTRDNLDLFR